jgi:hypothetical protein
MTEWGDLMFVLLRQETEWVEPVGVYSTLQIAEQAKQRAEQEQSQYYRAHDYPREYVKGKWGDTFVIKPLRINADPEKP